MGISQNVTKPNYNNLLGIRKSIQKFNLMDYVLYLINIKIDENEIALIFTIHKILIYELSSLKKVYENDINKEIGEKVDNAFEAVLNITNVNLDDDYKNNSKSNFGY